MRFREGRRIWSDSPMNAVAPFIMPTRCGAANQFYATIDIKKCEDLIKNMRAEGYKNIGMIHVFMAAYVRVIAQLPGINRYIRGQRVYARKEIEICMAIKKELKLNAQETVIKVFTNPSETLQGVYEQLNQEIVKNKKSGDQNSMDLVARILVSLPSILLKLVVILLKGLDYFGLLPRFLTKLSPFHGSLFITNMGSLGMPPIYHHLYNFGNLPVFVGLGKKRTKYVLNKEGEPEKKRLIDFTVVCDERICDGHYYAAAFKKLKRILEEPEQLLYPPKEIIKDIR